MIKKYIEYTCDRCGKVERTTDEDMFDDWYHGYCQKSPLSTDGYELCPSCKAEYFKVSSDANATVRNRINKEVFKR
jgi:Zn finger protein HypA/HybF involved in hydrogenase expression